MGDKVSMRDKIAADRVKSLVVHTRVDARSVADMALFFKEQGELVESKSQIVRMGFELMHSLLVKEGFIEEVIEYTQDALTALQAVGVRPGHELKHVATRVASQMKLEEFMFEGGQMPALRKTKSQLETVTEQAKAMAAEMDVEMVDRTCEKCEELHQVTESYLAEHGNVCLGCRLKEAG